jgi:hypothetical protein
MSFYESNKISDNKINTQQDDNANDQSYVSKEVYRENIIDIE